MRLRNFLFSFISTIFLTFTPNAGAQYNFVSSSKFASGKWIETYISATGLYRIPYTTLREMGFENPETVGVYGRGGRILPVSFTSPGDRTPYKDDISQVAVIHENESLYFYGIATEDIRLENNGSPVFVRYDKNIYSDKACYFLSDCEAPREAETSTCNSDAPTVTEGWDYIYHEEDLNLNSTGTGQLYWGETLLGKGNSLKWKHAVPYMAAGTARLKWRVYAAPESNATVTFSLDGTDKKMTVSAGDYDQFYEFPPRYAQSPLEFNVTGSDELNPVINTVYESGDYINLDYWLLTYPKKIPTGNHLNGETGERYALQIENGNSCIIPVAESLRVLDVTDPANIRKGSSGANGSGFTFDSGSPSIIIYDPTAEQLKIDGWHEVANNNLHALQHEGADFLIVTTPRFRKYAEEIANLHREHDGIKVAVATPKEIYNEFSGGIPDAMAIRAFAKMLYQNPGTRLRNILLLGPSDRNIRHKVAGETAFDRIIAPQQNSVSPDLEASPAYDLYGMTADNINESRLCEETVNVGVGLLSCENEEECERVIAKIREYLEDDNKAWMLNSTLSIGGLEDNHTHDQQAEDFGNLVRNSSETIAHTTIAQDAYGNENARRELTRALEKGKVITFWFGHGSRAMLGKDRYFFTTAEAKSLKNRHLGFIFLGGCDFSVPDGRIRGLGEDIVLDADRGMIGAVSSSRTAWSIQNFYLAKTFLSSWLSPSDKNISPTIGEVYAAMKSKDTNVNSLSFFLAGDPALRIPAPSEDINITAAKEAVPGEGIRIEGTVTKYDGSADTDFNGKVVIRLMQPSRILPSKDIETGTCNQSDGVTLKVTYDAIEIATFETEAAGGKFVTNVVFPSSTTDFTGQECRIVAASFDRARWLGASGEHTIKITEQPQYGSVMDSEAPAISLTHDNGSRLIRVSVIDNIAVTQNPTAFELLIDGKKTGIFAENISGSTSTSMTFTGYADTSSLPAGKHTCSLSARDIAGNPANSGIEFEVLPVRASLKVSVSTKAVTEMVEISVTGNPGDTLEYEIRSSKTGETVYKTVTTADSITWDGKGTDGNLCSAGLYRVRALSPMEGDGLRYSDWENFAILQ